MDDDVTIEDEGGPEIQKTPLGNQDLSFLQQTGNLNWLANISCTTVSFLACLASLAGLARYPSKTKANNAAS